jgi:Uma2 family endonuclease
MSGMPGNDAMRPASPGVKLTYDDFLLFPDDGKRHELIDGEHYVTPSPASKHQRIVWNLNGLLYNYLQEHPVGKAFSAPLDVVFSQFDVVEPDLLFVSAERAGKVLTEKNIQGAPDLVVEIGCSATRKRDETTKRRLYERFGVAEYWIIDPEIDTIKVYRRISDRYERVAELALEARDTLTTPLLRGLTLPLSKIFEE